MKSPIPFTALFLSFAFNLISQKLNQEVKVDNQQPFLLGEITVDGLSSNTYKSWYKTNYDTYVISSQKIDAIKEKIGTFKILIFMGTWCGDSKREVPRFLKILESVDYPNVNLKIVALDKRKETFKKSPQGEEWELNIRRVPTFIFYKKGREVNRIIETPIESLEDDIQKLYHLRIIFLITLLLYISTD